MMINPCECNLVICSAGPFMQLTSFLFYTLVMTSQRDYGKKIARLVFRKALERISIKFTREWHSAPVHICFELAHSC